MNHKTVNEIIAELLTAIDQKRKSKSEETPEAQDKLIIAGTGLSYEELIQKPNANEILIKLHNRMVSLIDNLEERIGELEHELEQNR